ncbi:hypothetical protein ACFYSF_38520 [Streptomyces canus]|uniref:hypothetical protein n=1 Tax=Streptomyces canus TaxID=58343 RepID=UPI0036A43622
MSTSRAEPPHDHRCAPVALRSYNSPEVAGAAADQRRRRGYDPQFPYGWGLTTLTKIPEGGAVAEAYRSA